MGRTRRVYELSEAADEDLDNIFDYTVEEFGFDQAVAYVELIDEQLNTLVTTPEAGKCRDEVRKDLRSLPIGSHIIFYKFLPNCIWVVRVLHASRDVQKALSNKTV